LSGVVAHLLPINPPYGGLISVSVWCGRSARNTESAIIALAAIIKIACRRIPLICTRAGFNSSVQGCHTLRRSCRAWRCTSNQSRALCGVGVERNFSSISLQLFLCAQYRAPSAPSPAASCASQCSIMRFSAASSAIRWLSSIVSVYWLVMPKAKVPGAFGMAHF
jgi:hypothetical protein